MPYGVQELPSFSGLDFRHDPQEGAVPAVDMLNVDLDRQGRARSRNGTVGIVSTTSGSNTLTPGPIFAFRDASVSAVLLQYASTLVMVDYVTGTVLDTQVVGGPLRGAVMLGAPTETVGHMYITVTSGSTWEYTTAGGFAPVLAPQAAFAATQSPDNRLVLAYNTSTYPSRVYFSNPSDPTTFDTNDYVDLDPGNGERIQGMCSWNNQVFVFKASVFYIFYGNSVDSAGGPVFNFRAVRHNLPSLATTTLSGMSVVTGTEGVYFTARDGVYLTNGGQPSKVSAPLDALWTAGGVGVSYFTGGSLNPPTINLGYAQRRLFVTDTTTGNAFVFDPTLNSWMLWKVGAIVPQGVVSTTTGSGSREEMVFSYSTGTGNYSLGRTSATATTDVGSTAITSRYRTGFIDVGGAEDEKVIREILWNGSGNITVQVAVNDSATLGTAANLTGIGAGPVYEFRDRRAVRGRNLSIQVSGTSGSAWSLSRTVLHIRGERQPGLRSAA